MKISEAFSYEFEDIQWPTKLGVGALISLVPILNFAVVGYEVGIVRNVAVEAREPLPQWDDFGDKWRDGLILTLAGLVYAIPVFIGMGVLLAVVLASGAIAQYAEAQGASRPVAVPNVIALACFLVFLVLYSLLLSLIRPVILVLFSKEGTFASCFRLGEVLKLINRQPGPFLTVWVVIIGAGLAIGLVVGFINAVIGWIPCIGWTIGALLAFGTGMYLLAVDGYILGQFRLATLAPAGSQPAPNRTGGITEKPT